MLRAFVLFELWLLVVPRANQTKTQNNNNACGLRNKKVKNLSLKNDNVILMPNGEVAILHMQPQQKTEIEKEIFKKIDVAFLKIVHMLPDGCLSPECIIKLSERYPILPFTCSNCSNSEKLILKVGFLHEPIVNMQTMRKLRVSKQNLARKNETNPL